MGHYRISMRRRGLLRGISTVSLCSLVPISACSIAPGTTAHRPGAKPLAKTARPLPLSHVRLLPSPYAAAVEANQRYLMRLEPDRLLHNFHRFAGLTPKGEVYGGWESDTIAGHSLGHYMSALALLHAQTGNAEARRRLVYILDQLAEVQAAHGDGYVAGFTRRRKDGTLVDGREIFAEITAGDIRSAGFDLNGCWVPFYNWHKLYAGLFDAQTHCGLERGIGIAVKLGGYIEKVFAALDDAQVQKVLDCEHGGINESFAELYARTGDKRWLALAERLYHRRVLEPLVEQRDELANLHANTQIPKLIGLARLHELTGNENHAAASGFFWQTVTGHHSYVIGGNSDREYFSRPDTIADHITEQTCEACNSYNMLKLTRHLYGWETNAALFDYYERTHLNHILSQIDPDTGMVTYMTPLMSGTARHHSTPFDSFWCCVGSGMESHAKHGDSIWWEGLNEGEDEGSEDTLLVNLYIPSRLNWSRRNAVLEMTTDYPYDGRVAVQLREGQGLFTLALRIPGWAQTWSLAVNGRAAEPSIERGYAVVQRDWKPGDIITLELPMQLRMESAPGDQNTLAVLRGPMVLAADLGSDKEPYESDAPALVGDNLSAAFAPVAVAKAVYKTQGIGRPGDMRFQPFYSNHHRRSAVYFRHFTEVEWAQNQVAYTAEQARLRDLAARSVDVVHLGEMQPERDHRLESDTSYPVVYRGRAGRDARSGGFFAFRVKVKPGPLVLQATYWGEERKRRFYILVDGERIASQALEFDRPGEFFEVDYPLPRALTQDKREVTVRFEPQPGNTAGPVFGVRLFTPKR